MLVSCVAVGSFAATAVSTTDNSVSASLDSESTAKNYGLASKIEDGNILHCFDWKYNDIKAELANIAEAGFTAVQTSPVQTPDPLGQWYGLYLPREFNCTSGPLGSKSELQELCTAADQYGIKIVCDVVANHLTGDHANIQNDLKPAQYWHTWGGVPDDKWGDRGWVTNGEIGMADLKTEDSYVQNVVYGYLQSLKDIGVDGFRFDAAKHIGLPSEGDGFWSKMSQIGLYRYGEILDSPGGDGANVMKEYANYIGVTDSVYSGTIMGAVRDGQVNISYGGNWVNQGVAPEKIVYWAESHDTFANNGGWTKYIDQNKVDRAYAVVGAKAKSQSLYLSRPPFTDKESIMSGQKGSTHFTSKEVAAVNHFHNAMVGLGEYMVGENNCYVVCRGNKTSNGGAVIVAASGSNMTVTVSNGGGLIPAGDYTDEVTGNHFTVTGSNISGQIGGTGIAVIYKAKPAGPSVSATPAGGIYKTDTLDVTLSYSEATSGTYSIDGGAAQSFTGSKVVTIGSGLDFGATTTITVTATNGTESDTQTYTFTKADPSLTQTVYFDNSSYKWSQVKCYMFVQGGTVTNGNWPGVDMTPGNNNIYHLDVPSGLENAMCVFTERNDSTTNRYPAEGDGGMPLNGQSMIFKANHAWEPYSGDNPTQPTQPTQPVGKVLIGDVDQNNSVTIKDATYIQMHCAEIITLTGDKHTAGDVDKNKTVNVSDVTALQRYLAHFEDSNCYAGKYTDGTEPTTPPTTPTTPTTPTNPIPQGNYIFFQNTKGWSTVYAHMWNSQNNSQTTTWHGNPMTLLQDNVWYVELPSGYDRVVFNDNASDQTDDISIPATGMLYNDDTKQWTAYGTSQPITQPTNPVSGKYVILNCSACNKGDECWYIWTWEGNEEGEWIGATDYSSPSAMRYESDKLKSNIIFVRMNPDGAPSWGSKWNQTDNLTFTNGKTYTITGWGGDYLEVQ